MIRPMKIAATIIVASGLAVTTYLVQAHEANSNDADIIKQANVTLYNAVEIALQQVPGSVVATSLENEGGKGRWEVEVLAKNNQVYDLDIDADSGKILKQEKDERDESDDGEHDDRD